MAEIRTAAVIVLAAGGGTRMKSSLPKPLHSIAGRSLLGHVLAATSVLAAPKSVVVVGHGSDQVIAHLDEIAPEVSVVHQEVRGGTGHAVRLALEALPELAGPVLVVPGDTPLLTGLTISRLAEQHARSGAAATVLSARLPDPTGYGRVVRAADGSVSAIVEDKDATAAERAIDEINTSVYMFDAAALRPALARVGTDNAQGEQYLTDVLGILRGDGLNVDAMVVPDHHEALGVNDRIQLAEAARILRDRIVAHWMRDGVSVLDPQTTWIDADCELEPDAVLAPNTQLKGFCQIRSGAEVGPNSTLTDCTVESGAAVRCTYATGAEIGPSATVGPWTYLRPGTRIGSGGKVGAFCETKNADLADGAKVPHLSYVGDATIGEATNIGAGTIVANYDGVDKHHTTVGRDVRIGSHTVLVAPVEVGDGAYTAAGSIITDPVPPGALAVARGRQHNSEGWTVRKRPGSAAAAAAQGAEDADQASDQ